MADARDLARARAPRGPGAEPGLGPVAVGRREADDAEAAGAPRACRRPATHGYAALAFYTAGRARLEQAGRWELAAGDVMIVPAGAPHRMLDARRPAYWGLALHAPCFAAAGAAALLAPFERVRDGAAAVVRVPAARHAFLEALFRELEAHARAPGRGAEAHAAVERSLVTLILREVEHAAPPLPRAAGGGGVVVESLRYIERHCLRAIGPADVAAAVGRSAAYVTTALTRATGRSAGAWIASGRMAEARRLLLRSDERVDAIAARVGYADATHFIRTFRRAHGSTPAAWRAAHRRAP